MALTDTGIRNLKSSESRRELPDGREGGLYLIVQPGGAKSWAYRFKSPITRKTRKMTLGRFPGMGVSQAREKAQAARRTVRAGRDPVLEHEAEVENNRKQEIARQDNTMDALLDRFLQVYAEQPGIRPKSVASRTSIIDRELRPRWATRNIREVSKLDVAELISSIRGRGHPVAALNARSVCSSFFRWAVDHELIARSPVPRLSRTQNKLSERDRVLSADEIRSVWEASERLTQTAYAAAVKLLLLLGQRREEVTAAEWGEFDFDAKDGAVWHIPEIRTKNHHAHTLPLPKRAVEIIQSQPRRLIAATRTLSRFVLTSSGERPLSTWTYTKAALDKEIAKLREEQDLPPMSPWVVHDLRRTAASHMAELGVAPHVIERILNHRSGSVRGIALVYNRHEYQPEMRAALSAWANRIDQINDPKARTNVVPFVSR